MAIEAKPKPFSPEYYGFVKPTEPKPTEPKYSEPETEESSEWGEFDIPDKSAIQAKILELRKAQLQSKYFK